jgi:hypothetical protein
MRAPFWGLWQTYMSEWKNKQTSASGDGSIPVHGDHDREHRGGSLIRDSEGKIKRDILREM